LGFTFDYTQVARFIFSLFFSNDKPVYVILIAPIGFGVKAKSIFLYWQFAYERIAIPLFWAVLPKAGSSNFVEQQMILSRFIRTFGKRCVAGILADREFGNGHLFRWLNQQKIAFYIRIKEDSNAWIFALNHSQSIFPIDTKDIKACMAVLYFSKLAEPASFAAGTVFL
jgi:hypothetical protein